MQIHANVKTLDAITKLPCPSFNEPSALYLDWRCALFLPRATVFFIDLDGAA
jgi:hypothetical protein